MFYALIASRLPSLLDTSYILPNPWQDAALARLLQCNHSHMAKKKKIVVPQEWGGLLPVPIENPDDMLEEYFTTFDMKVCKQVMWIFLRETMTGNFVDTMSRTDRDRVFHFYAYTTSLLEALHYKHKKQQKKIRK